MADGGSDDQERTEEPTTKKIEDARRKGQVAFSREVTSFLMFVVFALFIIWMLPALSGDAVAFLSNFFKSPEDIMFSYQSFDDLMGDIAKAAFLIFFIPIAATLFAALLSSFAQNGIVISAEPLIPKLDKISPIAGFKRLFSLKSFMEFLKGLFKISFIAIAAYLILENEMDKIIAASSLDIRGYATLMAMVAFKIVLAATIFMLFVAILDYSYQRYEYIKQLKMTQQEIKEEFKQTEGDPQIKAKLRQIRESRAKNRMISKVPEADVVIRNPTHFAVALEYKEGKMTAPVVTALGQDIIALNIIKVAEGNKIPVVTNRALARALYETAELDEEIPLEHYKAVAEVIAYVYKLKGKMAA